MTKLLGILVVAAVLAGAVWAYGIYRHGEPLAPDVVCDRVLVEKAPRQLIVISNGRALKSYRISLGGQPHGAKHREGDQKTPEGLYRLGPCRASRNYHRSMPVSYPGAQDYAYARSHGIKPEDIGGAIMVHGLPPRFAWLGGLHTLYDWTAGCIALTNGEIDELCRVIRKPVPLEIRP